MPVTVHAETRRLSSEECGRISYEVMEHTFAVQRELGRCFDEEVYQREIAHRCGGQIEVPVEVVHESFRKWYFLDLLVAHGALFEIKTATTLTDHHRNQLLYYLLLTELPRGKVVNLRTTSVQHEFVNAPLTLSDRTTFSIDDGMFDRTVSGANDLHQWCCSFLNDLGTGLSVALYEEAMVHFLGGETRVKQMVPVLCGNRQVGSQRLLLAASDAAFRVTTFNDQALPEFGAHLVRMLSHTPLRFLHWINIHRGTVTFTTLHRDDRGNMTRN